MDTYADTDETLQPEPRELSGESLLTTDYLGVRENTLHTYRMLNKHPCLIDHCFKQYVYKLFMRLLNISLWSITKTM